MTRMRRGLVWGVALGGAAAGLVVGWFALTRGRDGSAPAVVFGIAVGWAFLGAGLALLRARPRHPVGVVMSAVGVVRLVELLSVTRVSWAATLGWLVGAVPLAGLVILLLAFPGGRLATRLQRWVAVAALTLATVVQFAWLLVRPTLPSCAGCTAPPANALLVRGDSGLADAVELGQNTLGALLALVAIGVLVRRWRRGSPALRRQVAPVLWVGAGACAVAAVALVGEVAGRPLRAGPWLALALLTSLIPVAMAWVLLRRRLDRAGVAGLVVELGAAPSPARLSDALATTLGDPGLEVLFWLPQQQRYVDAGGVPAASPVPGVRSVTHVQRSGERIASLVHDPVLDDQPELLESVCAAAALALENERLHVELLARAADLQASRARLVEVGDRERRRIERDLHDGAQQSLVSAALTLGLARAREGGGAPVGPLLGEAQGQLERALGELRQLARGLLPPMLRERGLPPALAELAKRAPIPVATHIGPSPPITPAGEVALYFVASEALANVAKHARAAAVTLTLDAVDDGVRLCVADDGVGGADPQGAGLEGLADRVGALGGTFSVRSGSGGTVVEAWVPCELS